MRTAKPNHPEPDRSPLDLNVRRDLLAFIEYVQKRGIKRGHRDNQIPKGDRKRLAKLLGVPEVLREIEDEEGCWTDWICGLAHKLELVSYDTEGIFVGYTSQTESYPDNYIQVNEKALAKYLTTPSSEKERRILAALVEKNPNEFYHASLLGTQDRFDTFGSAVGAASRMNLPHVRRRLLAMLASYPAGRPVPFADFIKRVRAEEPNLIIDHERKPEPPPKHGKQAAFYARQAKYSPPPQPPRPIYECLSEHRYNVENGNRVTEWRTAKGISDKDPNAFFRAEGRYLAYFFEEIPVLMQFVQLEYGEADNPARLVPEPPNFIKTFTVTEKLGIILEKRAPNIDDAKVTITPDFRVLVEAPLYPDALLAKLAPYAVLKTSDRHTHILELSREKTIETLTSHPAARPLPDVLAEVAGPVPRNVAADIAEWIGHAEKCVVFDDVCLVELRHSETEAAAKTIEELRAVITRAISPRFHMATRATAVFDRLETLEQVPSIVSHLDTGLREALLPREHVSKHVRSRPKSEKALPQATWGESAMAAYASDNLALLQDVASQLRAAGVAPVLLDAAARILAVPADARAKVNGLIRKQRSSYDLTFK